MKGAAFGVFVLVPRRVGGMRFWRCCSVRNAVKGRSFIELLVISFVTSCSLLQGLGEKCQWWQFFLSCFPCFCTETIKQELSRQELGGVRGVALLWGIPGSPLMELTLPAGQSYACSCSKAASRPRCDLFGGLK